MGFRLALAIFVICLGGIFAEDYTKKDYCKFKCGSSWNVACNNTGKPAERCTEFQEYKITDVEKDLFVNEHNKYRSLVARGLTTLKDNVSTPIATNMHKLVWNEELAYLANLNVLKCKMIHDCAKTEQWNGQNLFSWSTNGKPGKDTYLSIIKTAVKAWVNERTYAYVSDITKFTRTKVDTKDIGHFTQACWGTTTSVGCAITSHKTGKWTNFNVACNYVGGNLVGSSVYQVGELCASCPDSCVDGLCV